MAKILSMYGAIIIYLILSATVLTPSNFPLLNMVINPVIWIILAAVIYLLAKNDQIRTKGQVDKVQSLLIVMIAYIIIYFCIGLFSGFQKTPYAKDLLSIIKNIWAFGSLIVLEEVARNGLIRLNRKKWWNLTIVTILFTLVQINFFSLSSSLGSIQSAFTYISSIIFPIIASNILLTYLSYIGGTRLPIIYRLFMTMPQFLVPIVPDLNWFITAVIGITVPLIVYIYLNYIHVKKTERLSKRSARKYSPWGYVPALAILVVVVLFVVGAFKYQPVAVLSGSMTPYFNRGDAVVIEKLSKSEKDNLKKGDVIQFVSGGKYVIHRIVKIEKDENLNRIFKTKGDFNNVEDSGTVGYDQVIGKLSFIIPFIGYPSVWLNEALR